MGEIVCVIHDLCVINPDVAMLLGSPIGGLVGVEGDIPESK